jgi:hypothetical protein
MRVAGDHRGALAGCWRRRRWRIRAGAFALVARAPTDLELAASSPNRGSERRRRTRSKAARSPPRRRVAAWAGHRKSSADVEALASKVENTEGVASCRRSGLGAPHWDPTHAESSAASRGTTAHIARATLGGSPRFGIFSAMEKDAGAIKRLRRRRGHKRSLMQFRPTSHKYWRSDRAT